MENRYLFRGKRLDNGEWITGSFHTYGDGVFISEIELRSNQDENWQAVAEEVIPESVGQCTGKKDEKGSMLVYEGDVVKFTPLTFSNRQWSIKFEKPHIGIVIYNKKRSCYDIKTNNDAHNLVQTVNIEIIGNKTDNPKLLESSNG